MGATEIALRAMARLFFFSGKMAAGKEPDPVAIGGEKGHAASVGAREFDGNRLIESPGVEVCEPFRVASSEHETATVDGERDVGSELGPLHAVGFELDLEAKG